MTKLEIIELIMTLDESNDCYSDERTKLHVALYYNEIDFIITLLRQHLEEK